MMLTSMVPSATSLSGVVVHQAYRYVHMYKEDGLAVKGTVRVSRQRHHSVHV